MNKDPHPINVKIVANENILNMKSTDFHIDAASSTKLGLKFNYEGIDKSEYFIFLLKDGEPWQKILIRTEFLD